MSEERHITRDFERHVERVGSHRAVQSLQGSMTYGELDACANGITEELHRLRAGPDTRIALLSDQQPAGFAALIGILKSGATCVPLCQTDPNERLSQIVGDCAVHIIVTHTPYGDRLRRSSLSGVRILDVHDVAPAQRRSFELPDSNSHLTFILYTSGSTGRAKGVLQSHALTTFNTKAWIDQFSITPTDRTTLFATFATGQGNSWSLVPLLSGATLCPFNVREEGVLGMSTWLQQQGITVYGSSVTLFRSMAKQLAPDSEHPALRLIRLGGERVSPSDVELARRCFPRVQLFQSYSATETANIATFCIPADLPVAGAAVVPVGRPSSGRHIRILGANGREVGLGETGEIVVCGGVMSSGYWNDPVHTNQVFAPLADNPGEPTCRIGDLGCLRSDGSLEHHGRKDFRFKIRGFRVELEEVEAAIGRHPDVARAAAAAKPRANGVDLALVTYVQTVKDVHLTSHALRSYLAERLPDHLIPSIFVFLDSLPLTPSGKLDRGALPDPWSESHTASDTFVAPRSPVETAIANIWKDVLDLNTVGVHDHFLEVGGDSLRATQVAARLHDALNVKISMRDLFEASTVAELATAVEHSSVAE